MLNAVSSEHEFSSGCWNGIPVPFLISRNIWAQSSCFAPGRLPHPDKLPQTELRHPPPKPLLRLSLCLCLAALIQTCHDVAEVQPEDVKRDSQLCWQDVEFPFVASSVYGTRTWVFTTAHKPETTHHQKDRETDRVSHSVGYYREVRKKHSSTNQGS